MTVIAIRLLSALLLTLSLPALVAAQVLAWPFPYSDVQLTDDNGDPCDSCQIETYLAGTSTAADTYTNASAPLVANAWPVVLGVDGRPTSAIFVGDRAYKYRLKSADGLTVIWERDYVVVGAAPTVVYAKTGDYSVTSTDGRDVLIVVDASAGNVTIALYTAVGNGGRVVRVKKTDSSTNTVTVDANGSQTIDGDLTQVLLRTGETLAIASDGANWQVLTSTTGTGRPFLAWTAQANQPPASAYATFDTRNSHPVLDFDGASDEEAVFGGVLPAGYALGGLSCKLFVAFTTATSGTVRFQAAWERMDASSLDIDADSFAAFQSAGGTAPSTSGQVIAITIPFTNGAQMDSLVGGEAFRFKVRRDADGTSGTDDIATDAELLRVSCEEL